MLLHAVTPAAQHVAFFIAGFLLGCFVSLAFKSSLRRIPWIDRLEIRRATKNLKDKTDDLKHAIDGVNAKEN